MSDDALEEFSSQQHLVCTIFGELVIVTQGYAENDQTNIFKHLEPFAAFTKASGL